METTTPASPKKHWKTIQKEQQAAEAANQAADSGKQGAIAPKPTVTSFQKKTPNKFIKAFEEQEYYYVQTRVNTSPSIKNSRNPFFNQRYLHPGIDVINHPDKGSCKIRYIPGESSIFADEQSMQANDNSCTPIIFIDGLCKVNRIEKNLKLFLDLCNANSSAPNRNSTKKIMFFCFDSKKVAKKAYDSGVELARAMVYFDDKSKTDEGIEELMSYAKTLGINMARELSEIKADLSTFLKNDPQSFLQGLNNPNMKRKYIILEAIDLGVLIKDPNSGTISWAAGGALCTPPIGKDPVEYCVEWCSDKGRDTFDYIREQTEQLMLERA